MESNKPYKNLQVTHCLNRRIRISASCLRNDIKRSHVFQIVLLKRPAIENVRVDSRIGSVTIHFDPDQLPVENLLTLLDSILGNIGVKSAEIASKKGKQDSGLAFPKQDFNIAIEGMKCASCALFLEMTLKKDARIDFAKVNFEHKTALIRGRVSQAMLFEMISQCSFQAHSLEI